jgi:enolase-phosphatase E1
MIETKARGILLDIEGTTSSISFVYDVMFPYVRDHVASFLESDWNDPTVQQCLALLAEDLDQESLEAWLGGLSVDQQKAKTVQAVMDLMDADVKATGLKQLQGLIWKNGFHRGQLVAHLFADVDSAIRKWSASGVDVRIYSSGSIQAQKLFFGHTVAGNLLDRLSGFYDTTTGPKQEAESYRKIAAEFPCEPSEILFISDVVEELKAAKIAGLQTALSLRPGNKPVEAEHGFAAIESFDEIKLIASTS